MYYELILAAILIPGIFLMKNCPKTPPSGFANTDVKVPFGEAVKTLFKNKDFVLSMIPFSLYFGILKGFSVVTPYLLEPFGYNSS
jgi:nitrate/nitrite transporter NarK